MPFALVGKDGRYHGHVADEAEGKAIATEKKYENAFLFSEADWTKLAALPTRDERVALVGTLSGIAL